MEANIINSFGFTLNDNIYEWGENYVQNHPNYIFEELEQAFCKKFKIVKNNEEVYMQLGNIKQQTTKHVQVYYECPLKLSNCVQVRTTNVFLTIVFKVGLLPYLRLTTIGMKRNVLIKHKEATIGCEEGGFVNLNYNVLLTTLEANAIVKHVVLIITSKSTLTCTNCGKTGHLVETCHNKKREVLVVLTTIVKST